MLVSLHVTVLDHFNEKNAVICTFFVVGWVFLMISLRKNFLCSVLSLVCLLIVMWFLDGFSFISLVEVAAISCNNWTHLKHVWSKSAPFLLLLWECNISLWYPLLSVCLCLCWYIFASPKGLLDKTIVSCPSIPSKILRQQIGLAKCVSCAAERCYWIWVDGGNGYRI